MLRVLLSLKPRKGGARVHTPLNRQRIRWAFLVILALPQAVPAQHEGIENHRQETARILEQATTPAGSPSTGSGPPPAGPGLPPAGPGLPPAGPGLPAAGHQEILRALQGARQGIPQARAQGRSAIREAMAIQRAMAGRQGTGRVPPITSLEGGRSPRMEHLVVFVSGSIPEPSLQALFEQAADAGALVVFRGVQGNTFLEMASWLEGLFEGRAPETLPRMVIDPRLFKRFGIEAVPAFALSGDGICTGPEGTCQGESGRDTALVAGNVTLDYALRALTHGRPDLESQAEAFLARLEDDHG